MISSQFLLPEVNPQRPEFLCIASDLHFEWRIDSKTTPAGAKRVVEKAIPHDELDQVSILILAGDICSHNQFELVHTLLAGRFLKVIHVLGNHEAYGTSIAELDFKAEQTEKDLVMLSTTSGVGQVYFSSNFKPRVLAFDNVSIFFQTLWADCGRPDPIADFNCGKMQDFVSIRWGYNQVFDTSGMVALNHIHAGNIETFLKIPPLPSVKRVVVTHHLPSHSLQDPKYSPSPYDGIFSSNQDHLLAPTDFPPANLWVYGHTHTANEGYVGNTRFVCNPRGYPREPNTYNDRLFVEISKL